MSWSKSLGGTPAEITEQLAQVAAEVQKNDEQYSSSEGIVTGHQREIAQATATVEKFLDGVPDGYSVSGSINGHTDGVTSDNVNVSLSCFKPTPVSS